MPDPDVVSAIEWAIAEAREHLRAGDHEKPACLFSQIVEHAPHNIEALAGLARAALAAGDLNQARWLLDRAPKAEHPDFDAVRTVLNRAEFGKLGRPSASSGLKV